MFLFRKIATTFNYILLALKWSDVRSSLGLFYYFLIARLHPRKPVPPRPVRLRLDNGFQDWWIRPADIFILKEVLDEGCYSFHELSRAKISCILDIGAHVGFSVLAFQRAFPGVMIDAYEPAPSNFNLLTRHFGRHPKVRCIQAAIADEPGSHAFFVDPFLSCNNSLIASECGPLSERIEVEAITLDQAITNAPRQVDLIKFDIEGAERSIFSRSERIHETPWLVGEVKGPPHVIDHLTQCLGSHRLVNCRSVGKVHTVLFARNDSLPPDYPSHYSPP